MVVVDTKRRTCKFIDFVVPGDSWIEEKQKVKIEKYQDLRRELQKIWNVRVNIMPLAVGSVGTLERDWYHSRNRASSEDNFIRNG